jgi:hypothetical protein
MPPNIHPKMVMCKREMAIKRERIVGKVIKSQKK